jgi:hypothetical protein
MSGTREHQPSETTPQVDATTVSTTPATQETVVVTQVHRNVEQELIMITSDRAELCLRNHLDRVAAASGWHTPVGMFASIVLSLATSTFHDTLGLSAATIQASYLLAAVLTGVWSGVAVYRAMTAPATVEDVLASLKRSALRTA